MIEFSRVAAFNRRMVDQTVEIPKNPIECRNFVGGKWEAGSLEKKPVKSPYTGGVIGNVMMSSRNEVNSAIVEAARASRDWGQVPLKERTQLMFRLREILIRDIDKFSHSVSSESGKLLGESRAGVLKGIEVLEFALSLQNLDLGGRMEVSRGVFCEYRREALGVVAGITPFNFPFMVPMWMIPIAITLGNSFVWKPSDKTPLTSLLLAGAFAEAGLPSGVLTIVQGGVEAVNAICDHPLVGAVGFVGSTPVAKTVYQRATGNGKRSLTLGGAKNHIILMPDAQPELAVDGIVASFTGCAGQRCMAASNLLLVGGSEAILSSVVERAKKLEPGKDIGAIISREAMERIHESIDRAVKEGATILLDGRGKKNPQHPDGFWMGATILDHVNESSFAAREEIFGPVLSVIRVGNLSQALDVENKNPYGNASSVFTSSGAIAEEVARRSRAGMIGVNIGVPVPREPFSFGGLYDSKFGHGDITGSSSLDLWTAVKKITTKWMLQKDQNWMS